MKTIAFACLLVLTNATAAAAQKLDVQLGFHVEGISSNVVGTGTETAWARTTIGLGGVLVLQPRHSIFALETGLSYVGAGASDSARTMFASVRLGYIEVPALLRIAVPLPGLRVRPVVSLGPVVGIRARCELNVHNASSSSSVSCTDVLANHAIDLKTADIGATARLSVDIPVGPRLVVFPRFSYTRSLAGIENSTAGSVIAASGVTWLSNSDVKNRVLQFGVGARWTLR